MQCDSAAQIVKDYALFQGWPSDGQFYRVGGHTPMTANVRVIAATHQDLEARVKQGVFREDLYHRLTHL